MQAVGHHSRIDVSGAIGRFSALALFAATSRSALYLSQRNSDSGAFPNGAHDDQGDAMIQAPLRLEFGSQPDYRLLQRALPNQRDLINGKYITAALVAKMRSNFGHELQQIDRRLEVIEERCADRPVCGYQQKQEYPVPCSPTRSWLFPQSLDRMARARCAVSGSIWRHDAIRDFTGVISPKPVSRPRA